MDMNLEKVALLARIRLKEDEKKKLAADFENILGYVKQLDQVNTGSAVPTSHVLSLENVFRADELKPKNVTEKALEHAPDREGTLFKVPKVIEGE